MIDIHSHLLPGFDDGPRTIEESLEICRIAAEDGVTALVASPHHLNGVYRNEREKILEGVHLMKECIAQEGLSFEVYPGSEVQLDGSIVFEQKNGRIATLNDGGKFLLVELPRFFSKEVVLDQIHELKHLGVVPIISHPERSQAIVEEIDLAYLMIREGALMQLTAASILGKAGRGPQRIASLMLERRMAHFVASDAHGAEIRPPGLSLAFNKVVALVGQLEALRIFYTNPEAVIEGQIPFLPSVIMPEPKKKGYLERLSQMFKKGGS